MSLTAEYDRTTELSDRLRACGAVTAEFIAEIAGSTCQRLASMRHTEQAARLQRLIRSGAWTDAALALIELELPQWQLRRLAYDEGEWHCALSPQRELPEWLDQSVETRHADLALAILAAFVEARCIAAPSGRTSVPAVKPGANLLYDPLNCENYA